MIIWNGLIWTALKLIDSDEYIFFASWVSDSKINDEVQFIREIDLLNKYLDTGAKLIYFSSCSIYDTTLQSTPYVTHKKNIEKLICQNASNYLIVRISNIVWNAWNSNNIMNFLYEAIKTKKDFNIWKDAERSLLDVEDLVVMLDNYLQSFPDDANNTITLANPMPVNIFDMVKAFESFLNISAHTTIEEKWEKVNIYTQLSKTLFPFNHLSNTQYLTKLINKYY